MNQTAMVVDDDPFIRSILRIILESGGYRVVAEAMNGVEAVDCYRRLRPGVTLMDNMMPEKNGIEACREILAINPEAKLVMCSSQELSSLEALGRPVGVHTYITKPFTSRIVLDTVSALLS